MPINWGGLSRGVERWIRPGPAPPQSTRSIKSSEPSSVEAASEKGPSTVPGK